MASPSLPYYALPISAPKQTQLRRYPQRSKFYLGIQRGATLYSARVNGAQATGATAIPLNNASGTAGNVKNGMTVYFGSTAGGKNLGAARIKGLSGSTLTIAANGLTLANGTFVTISNIFRLWPVNNDDPAFGGQAFPPVPLIGSARAGFVGEDIAFASDRSFSPVSTSITSTLWDFNGGTIRSGGTTASVGDNTNPLKVRFPAAGEYAISCTKTDSNALSTTAFRPVLVYDRGQGTNAPFTNFRVVKCEGTYPAGWNATFRVYGTADEAAFPSGGQVVLFAEDWYGPQKLSIGGAEAQPEIIYTGFILKATVSTSSTLKYVDIETSSVDEMMKLEYCNAVSFKQSGSPANWHEISSMTVAKCLWHFVIYHTTLLNMVDVIIYDGSKSVTALDIASNTMHNILDQQFLKPVFGNACGSRFGELYLQRNFQMISVSQRQSLSPSQITFEKDDWRGDLSFGDEPITKVSQVHLECYLPDLTAVIADSPTYPSDYGDRLQDSGYLVTDGPDAVVEASRLRGWRNNQFPSLGIKLANYRVLEPASQDFCQIRLKLADNTRGLNWDAGPGLGKEFITRGASFLIDKGYLLATYQLEGAVYSPISGTFYIAPTPPCPAGTHWDSNSRICVPDGGCPPGTHQNPNTGLCDPDVTCAPGEYPDPWTGQCIPTFNCPPGTHWDDTAQACLPDQLPQIPPPTLPPGSPPGTPPGPPALPPPPTGFPPGTPPGPSPYPTIPPWYDPVDPGYLPPPYLTSWTLVAQTVSSSQIDLDWSTHTPSGVTSFEIYRSTVAMGPYSMIDTAAAGTLVYSDTGLTSATTYYYFIRALIPSGAVASTNSNATTLSIPGGSGSGTWATYVYAATEARGIHYTENFGDVNSGYPTWQDVSAGLASPGTDSDGNTRYPTSSFFVDPFSPHDYQYCLGNPPTNLSNAFFLGTRSLYRRDNRATWTELWTADDLADAAGVAYGAGGALFEVLFPDPNVEGWLGLFLSGGDRNKLYFLSSTDRGATWSSATLIIDVSGITSSFVNPGIRVIGKRIGISSAPLGNIIYAPATAFDSVDNKFPVSTDRGATWTVKATYTDTTIVVDPNDQDIAFAPDRLQRSADYFNSYHSIAGDLPVGIRPNRSMSEDMICFYKRDPGDIPSGAIQWIFAENSSFAVGSGRLWLTSDGGSTYRSIEVGGLPNDGYGYAVAGFNITQLEDAEGLLYGYADYDYGPASPGDYIFIIDFAQSNNFVGKDGGGIPSRCEGIYALVPYRA